MKLRDHPSHRLGLSLFELLAALVILTMAVGASIRATQALPTRSIKTTDPARTNILHDLWLATDPVLDGSVDTWAIRDSEGEPWLVTLAWTEQSVRLALDDESILGATPLRIARVRFEGGRGPIELERWLPEPTALPTESAR